MSIPIYHLKELTIEITQKCPNKCLFCSSFVTKRSPNYITINKVLDIGENAKNLGLSTAYLSGGEPLCHPALLEIVRGLSNIGIETWIYTCGQYLDDSLDAQPYLQWIKFKEYEPKVIFNIQSFDAVIHDKLANVDGSHDRTHKSLLSAIDAGLRTEIHIIPMKDNLDTLAETVQRYVEIGVHRISFLRLVIQGFARKNVQKLLLDENEELFLKRIHSDLSRANWNGAELRFGTPWDNVLTRNSGCNAGNGKLVIRYDGFVIPCEGFKDVMRSGIVLGNIDADSLSSLLVKSSKCEQLQALKIYARTLDEPCAAQVKLENYEGEASHHTNDPSSM